MGRTAYLQGNWVMIPPHKGSKVSKDTGNEYGNLDEYGLFYLKEDPGQLHNLADKNKKLLEKMKQHFMELINIQPTFDDKD